MDKCKALYSLPKNVHTIAGEPANDYRLLSYESNSSALHQETTTRVSWLHDESSIAGGCCNSSVVFDEITTPFLTTKITRDITWVWEVCRSSVFCAAINERAPHSAFAASESHTASSYANYGTNFLGSRS